MYLVKYTAKKWCDQAVSGASLRIGSVLYYREIESEHLRDEHEGEGRVIHRSSTPLTAEDRRRIFSEQSEQLSEDWTIDTGGIPLLSKKSELNPFVFSCALLKHRNEIPILARKFKSDAQYFIKDHIAFAKAVAQGLKNHLLQIMQSQDARMPQSAREKLHRLEVVPFFGAVKYIEDSKDRIVTDDNIKTFLPNQLRIEPFFQKPHKFQGENEFRFIWLINLGDIEMNDVDLTTTYLRTIDLKNVSTPIRKKPFSLSGIYNHRGIQRVT